MSTKISRLKTRAFALQSGRCFYCNSPMWLNNAEQFALKYQITLAEAKQLQCTAEHLVPLQDGGPTSSKNIAAACRFCNRTRHKRNDALSPSGYKMLVARRLSLHRWHGFKAFQKRDIASVNH